MVKNNLQGAGQTVTHVTKALKPGRHTIVVKANNGVKKASKTHHHLIHGITAARSLRGAGCSHARPGR